MYLTGVDLGRILRKRVSLALLILGGLAVIVALVTARYSGASSERGVVATRLGIGPIITPEMMNGREREREVRGNINGPSLIRVPDWIPDKLGNYYLYFANHRGEYIRLAYADSIEGPWRIYYPGTLRLNNTSECKGHVASPNVHAIEPKQELHMYFHCPPLADSYQTTYLAVSKDGLNFYAKDAPLGPAYFSVFKHGGWYYTITKLGGSQYIFRSKDGETKFERGPPLDIKPLMRHSAALVEGDDLWLFFSRTGAEPEAIEAVRMDLTKDWREWPSTMSPRQLVLAPERDYEGASHDLKPSKSGPAKHPVRQLRDPAIFEDDDGRVYLIYSVAGEYGLAVAELSGVGPDS